MVHTLGEIAELIKAELHGDADCEITGVATLERATRGQISFLANRRYTSYLKTTRASAVVLHKDDLSNCPVNALVIEDPYLAYANIAAIYYPTPEIVPGIHKSASIHPDATVHATAGIGPFVTIGNGSNVGENVYIGPGCVIDNYVTIGKNTRLTANVVLCSGTKLGERCLLHPGVVIGADGFGIANNKGKWVKIPQIGCVEIGNDVEIGANSSIDRGAIENTVIENGVKIDNQVQIGHNVHIGEHTAIAGCVGIAGSTRIGKRCMIGGAAGISGHIEITDDVVIMGMAGVANSIKEPGVYASAIPSMDVKLWRKNAVLFKQLTKLNTRLTALEKQLKK